MTRFLLSCLIILFTVTSDELLGRYVLTHLPKQVAINEILNIVQVWNSGVAFGLFNNMNANWIFLGLSALVIIIFVILLITETQKIKYIPYAVIIGGALGNVIDRLRYGAVFDFIDLHLGNLHWPAFNLADAFIFLGGVMIVWNVFFANKMLVIKE